MAGFEWTEQEIALVLYYAAAGIRQCDIVKLLRRRNFSRTLPGVEGKLLSLRITYQLGQNSRRLDKHSVYAIIDLLAVPGLDKLLEPTYEDQEIVNESGKSLDLWLEYSMWEIREVDQINMPLQTHVWEAWPQW
ncbi:hypothetical protein BDV25DRAFT_141736 [Aspergillus avenaceus]|uniref:Uncharacterized protein n=1 Tax=Aspergillus avenaceus TaxID=36643 RepID=A0A5N6TQ65_ASPAV|nr:hypothetical protein BDV25DRAFT_141736 [Aspergillus avenaceus]